HNPYPAQHPVPPPAHTASAGSGRPASPATVLSDGALPCDHVPARCTRSQTDAKVRALLRHVPAQTAISYPPPATVPQHTRWAAAPSSADRGKHAEIPFQDHEN